VSLKRADRVEAMLRQADASFEKWFRRTRKQSAGVLRHRVEDLQTALRRLSEGLKQVEQDRNVTLAPDQKVAPIKRRTRPLVARKVATPRKRKKAA
jgi:lauroyl/myristoyl acyltransferase